MLYTRFQKLFILQLKACILLPSCPHFPCLSAPDNHHSLCFYEFSCFLFLILHIDWNNVVFVFLCLAYVNPPGLYRISQMTRLFLKVSNIPLCYIQKIHIFILSSIGKQFVSIFWLLWIQYKKHGVSDISMIQWFCFLQIYTHKWDSWIIWQFNLKFLKEPPQRFSSWLYGFTCPPGVHNVPFSAHSLQHLLSLVFLIIGIFTDVRQYFIVVWIFISLVISDVEHLFIYLLTIYMSSLEIRLFRSFAHFLFG